MAEISLCSLLGFVRHSKGKASTLMQTTVPRGGTGRERKGEKLMFGPKAECGTGRMTAADQTGAATEDLVLNPLRSNLQRVPGKTIVLWIPGATRQREAEKDVW